MPEHSLLQTQRLRDQEEVRPRTGGPAKGSGLWELHPRVRTLRRGQGPASQKVLREHPQQEGPRVRETRREEQQPRDKARGALAHTTALETPQNRVRQTERWRRSQAEPQEVARVNVVLEGPEHQ